VSPKVMWWSLVSVYRRLLVTIVKDRFSIWSPVEHVTKTAASTGRAIKLTRTPSSVDVNQLGMGNRVTWTKPKFLPVS